VRQHTPMPKTRRGASRDPHVNRLRSPMRGLAGYCACAQPGRTPYAFGTHPRHRSQLPPCSGERAAMTGAKLTLPLAALQAPETHEAGDDGPVSWSILPDQRRAAARSAVSCPAAKRLT
jgi:hypothetical protein